MDEIRKIIRFELKKFIKENDETTKDAAELVKGSEELVDSLEKELKLRKYDSRVTNLPDEERKARKFYEKQTDDRLKKAKDDLELAKNHEENLKKKAEMDSQMKQIDTQVKSQVGGESGPEATPYSE